MSEKTPLKSSIQAEAAPPRAAKLTLKQLAGSKRDLRAHVEIEQARAARATREGHLVALILLLGVLTGAVDDVVVKRGIAWLQALRASTLGPLSAATFSLAEYARAAAWSAGLTGASLAVTRLVPFAAGGSIPELKTMLTGVEIDGYLALPVAGAKVLSLVCALGAGLSVGREGPLVHVSACLAEALMRAPPFRAAVHAVPALRAQVLAVAGALGVACTFTTPISAIFFSA